MFDIRLRTKRELKALFTNLKAKGITDEMAAILIDLCYNQPVTMRTSGFYWAGNPDAIMQWDDPSRTLTLTPRPADPELEGSENYIPHFRMYSWAKKPVLHDKGEAESIQLPDQEGLYVVYYETNGETGLQYLTYLKNPTVDDISVIYLVKIVVAVIYWNADWKQAVYFGEERHGSEWIPAMHWWAHGAFNAIRDHGLRITDLTIGDGSQDAHARFGVSAGAAWHEDIYSVVESDILSTEGLPVLYNIAGTPRFTGTDFFPVMNTGSGRIAYNNGPAGYAEAADRKFVFYHVFWTNCLIKPIIAVMGQAAFDQAREAVQAYQAELESLDIWMPHQTKLLISSLLFETSDDFTNSVKGRIVGEMTPEGIADIISEDNIPALKTGWNPAILEHMAFSYSEAAHQLQVDLLADFTTYFVTGIKYKIGIHLFFPALPNTLGMHYLTGNGQSWSHAFSWDEHATTYVKLAALYRNPRLSQTPYLGWRMHTWEMDGRTRGSIIDKTGLEILSGLSLSINAVNTHEIDVTDGSIRLAEIIANIVHNSGSTFGQFLRSLRARRHWLKTYVDDTDPQAPVVTHEWEYQDTPAANVASLSAGNQVVVNQCIEDVWQLVETADGDYSAMWLIATMDYAHPLKWITGVGADIDLDSAKDLNGPQTLLEITGGARFFTDHFRVIARVMVRNIAADPYYELIEIEDFSDVDLDQLARDIYVESAEYDNLAQQLILHRTGKLPDIRVPMNLLSEMSIRGDGSVIFPFSLENDEENPGPLYIYSTNQAGVKGWWPLFSSADPDSSASGSGADSSGSGSGSGGDVTPGLILDRYVSQILFDPVLRILTLKRTAGLSDLVVEIPGGGTSVQSDWAQIDDTAQDYIKNKPSIPAPQVQSDWNQADNGADDYIKNKPTIPAAQVQSDWNQVDAEALDYIKNKPSISGGTVESEMSITGDGSSVSKLKLINDEVTPGNSEYYGTNSIGTKGYHPFPSATSGISGVASNNYAYASSWTINVQKPIGSTSYMFRKFVLGGYYSGVGDFVIEGYVLRRDSSTISVIVTLDTLGVGVTWTEYTSYVTVKGNDPASGNRFRQYMHYYISGNLQ